MRIDEPGCSKLHPSPPFAPWYQRGFLAGPPFLTSPSAFARKKANRGFWQTPVPYSLDTRRSDRFNLQEMSKPIAARETAPLATWPVLEEAHVNLPAKSRSWGDSCDFSDRRSSMV